MQADIDLIDEQNTTVVQYRQRIERQREHLPGSARLLSQLKKHPVFRTEVPEDEAIASRELQLAKSLSVTSRRNARVIGNRPFCFRITTNQLDAVDPGVRLPQNRGNPLQSLGF
ncbi:hypothetical protein BOX37_25935 [Nocardia mangyaensis]|uniref:Uncharacterized protein n=1 Tax=Nocardia mangyaensis TaxID=2213200 RepID=A0A1J0VXS8_9NOCA|nr:hypothetical protein BOX37_25935 [Nocardia mangyaensis]